MGQFISKANAPVADTNKSSRSMGFVLAKATTFVNDDERTSLEVKAQKALNCTSVQPLKSGPCGSQFSEAFLCSVKSTNEEKGSDCVQSFVALQSCITCIESNANAFPINVSDNNKDKIVKKPIPKPRRDYKFHQGYMVDDNTLSLKRKNLREVIKEQFSSLIKP